jgi:heat shock protein HtpX
MMVVAVIIAGVVSFVAELVFRLWFWNGFSFRGSRSDDRRGGAGVAILIAIGLLILAYVLSFFIRLALSRSREFLADAGSVELTKNPDAMISALRKIESRGELPGATSAVMEMCVDNPRRALANCSTLIRRWKAASPLWSNMPAGTIPAPSTCRRPMTAIPKPAANQRRKDHGRSRRRVVRRARREAREMVLGLRHPARRPNHLPVPGGRAVRADLSRRRTRVARGSQ